jgi:hypothetical protein
VLALGLVLGNQIGVYGVSLLCGVGFTMSLFIGVLAFPGPIDSPEQVAVKLGVLGGSFLSAIFGAAVLAVATRRRRIRAGAGTRPHTGQANIDLTSWIFVAFASQSGIRRGGIEAPGSTEACR